MTITFYNNTSENSRIDKTTYLEEVLSIEGTLRDSCSVTTPVIQVQHVDFLNANYAYIPEFNRYYFIIDIVSVRTYLWEIRMSVDVLMSFKDQIKNLDAYVSRWQYSQEKGYIDSVRQYKSTPEFNIVEDFQNFKAPWFPEYFYNDLGLYYGSVQFVIVMTRDEKAPDIERIANRINNVPIIMKHNNISYTLGFKGAALNSGVSLCNRVIVCNYELLYKIINVVSDYQVLLSQILEIYILPKFPHYGDINSNYDDTFSNVDLYNYGVIPILNKKIQEYNEQGKLTPRTIRINNTDYSEYELRVGATVIDTSNLLYFLLTPSANYIFTCSYLISEGLEPDYKNIPPYAKYSLVIPMYGVYEIDPTYLINRKLFMNVYFDVTIKSYSIAFYSCGDNSNDIILIDTLSVNACSPIPLSSNGSGEVERQRSYNKMVRDIGYLTHTTNLVGDWTKEGGRLAGNLSQKGGLTKQGQGAVFESVGNIVGEGIKYVGNMIGNAMQYTANEILNVSVGTFNNFDSVFNSYQLLYGDIYLIKTTYSSTISDEDYARLVGLPYNKYVKLSTLNGFYIVSDIHLENISALEEEKTEIDGLLMSGVIG